MTHPKKVNGGLQIGTQNNQGSGIVNNIAGDMIVHNQTAGASLSEFQTILSQISSQLPSSNLSTGDKQFIEAALTQARSQAQTDSPRQNLIVSALQNAFDLITQAAGAATSVAAIADLLQKAITFAQRHF